MIDDLVQEVKLRYHIPSDDFEEDDKIRQDVQDILDLFYIFYQVKVLDLPTSTQNDLKIILKIVLLEYYVKTGDEGVSTVKAGTFSKTYKGLSSANPFLPYHHEIVNLLTKTPEQSSGRVIVW